MTHEQLFAVNISLTPEGDAHREEILALLFEYVEQVRAAGPQEEIFKELASLQEINFAHKEDSPLPDDFAASAAMALHRYPPKEVLRGPFALDEWRADVVEEYLSKLTADNCLVFITSDGFKEESAAGDADEKGWKTEQWYKVVAVVAVLGFLGLGWNMADHTASQGDLAAVRKMYSYWADGKLAGSSCVAAAKQIALEDVVYDASSDAMPHVGGAKVYHGPAGICDFGAFLATFRQPDYRLVEQLHSGTGTVVVKESLTPTVLATNKTVKQAMQNLVEYKVRDGKIASMKVYWGEPHTFDSLFH
ncbi:unnamed protein product [Effrenium voratum]|uniref:Peptidase M16 middle/third domain-containing protein n=1 Tax=Effrenium voratum TaxID=2562239 RepID=A0AA36N768_9DINO|nr:unnamed protein product [Effrenium voratum]